MPLSGSANKLIAWCLGALTLSLALTSCGYDGWIRYPCQEFDNWNLNECQAPECKVTGTCTADILGSTITQSEIDKAKVEPIDGLDYAQSCDELLGAISSQRLAHSGQEELTKQCLSAVKLPFGDGGWVMGRKVSNTTICGAIASALATHYATMAESGLDNKIS